MIQKIDHVVKAEHNRVVIMTIHIKIVRDLDKIIDDLIFVSEKEINKKDRWGDEKVIIKNYIKIDYGKRDEKIDVIVDKKDDLIVVNYEGEKIIQKTEEKDNSKIINLVDKKVVNLTNERVVDIKKDKRGVYEEVVIDRVVVVSSMTVDIAVFDEVET